MLQHDKILYINRLRNCISSYVGEIPIIGHWDNRMNHKNRALELFAMIETCYNGSHSIRDFITDIGSLIKLYNEDGFFTWFVTTPQGIPIATSSIEVINKSIAALTCSARISLEYYRDKNVTSTIMIIRIIDFFLNYKKIQEIKCIEGEVRLNDDFVLNNTKIPNGIKSQHINLKCELIPFLLCVPKIHYYLQGIKIVQFVNICRKYLIDICIHENIIFYIPQTDFESINIKCILEIIWKKCLNKQISFSSSFELDNNCPQYCELVNEGLSHYSILNLSGEIDLEHLIGLIEKAFLNTDYIEFVIPNSAENIINQNNIISLGAIPIGALPGGYSVEDTKITIHYGLLKNNLCTIGEIKLTEDYKKHNLYSLISQIHNLWKNGNGRGYYYKSNLIT